MNIYYYTLFIIFTVIATMIVLDNNVGVYLTLIFKMLRINFERLVWMIRFHPRNPIQKYLIWRRSWQLARELQKELKDGS